MITFLGRTNRYAYSFCKCKLKYANYRVCWLEDQNNCYMTTDKYDIRYAVPVFDQTEIILALDRTVIVTGIVMASDNVLYRKHYF